MISMSWTPKNVKERSIRHRSKKREGKKEIKIPKGCLF